MADFFTQSAMHGNAADVPARVGAMVTNSAMSQAAISGYNETFIAAGLMALLGIPMILLMKRLSHRGGKAQPDVVHGGIE